jgi:uncharacterized protein YcgI (DUF1989 family)
MQTETLTIPARSGKAARVDRGQSVTVINTHGSQVVDTWAFNSEDLGEWMSMEHSRPYYMKLRPEVADTLVTNKRRPILTLTEDTSGGAHDTLIAACDALRYRLLGVTGNHDNCADNLSAGLAELGLTKLVTPSPLNLFMNVPWTQSGGLSWEEPLSGPQSYVTLQAEMDLVIAFSACPQDILPINGRAGQPTEVHFRIV